MGAKVEFAIGVLNGAIGDYLARTKNALATPFSLVHLGEPIEPTREGLASAVGAPSPRVVILLHGLMCTEGIWVGADGGDYGDKLEDAFGVTALRVRYNSGLPIVENGEAFAALLDAIVANYPVPVEEIIPIGYSMGGLVVRSACHVASETNASWLPLVRRAFYIGTPHLGAPAERVGRLATRLLAKIPDPTVRLIADLAEMRSSGVKDLGDADLRHEDRNRDHWPPRLTDRRHPVPLLPEIRHHLVAGTLHEHPALATLFGDSVVPLPSGSFRNHEGPLPPERIKVLRGLSHMALAAHPHVYEALATWLGEDA